MEPGRNRSAYGFHGTYLELKLFDARLQCCNAQGGSGVFGGLITRNHVRVSNRARIFFYPQKLSSEFQKTYCLERYLR
jgi:hypothetical protein